MEMQIHFLSSLENVKHTLKKQAISAHEYSHVMPDMQNSDPSDPFPGCLF